MGELVVKRDNKAETLSIISAGGGTLQAQKTYSDGLDLTFSFEPGDETNELKLKAFVIAPYGVSEEWEINAINIF